MAIEKCHQDKDVFFYFYASAGENSSDRQVYKGEFDVEDACIPIYIRIFEIYDKFWIKMTNNIYFCHFFPTPPDFWVCATLINRSRQINLNWNRGGHGVGLFGGILYLRQLYDRRA